MSVNSIDTCKYLIFTSGYECRLLDDTRDYGKYSNFDEFCLEENVMPLAICSLKGTFFFNHEDRCNISIVQKLLQRIAKAEFNIEYTEHIIFGVTDCDHALKVALKMKDLDYWGNTSTIQNIKFINNEKGVIDTCYVSVDVDEDED